MLVHHLLDAVGSTGASATVNTQKYRRDDSGLAQVEITGTATVKVQGRNAPGAPWVDIHEFTSSGAITVRLFPEVQFNVTAYTSGDVSGWLAV